MTHTHTHTDPAKNVTLNKSGSAFLVVAQMTHVMCSCEVCEIVVCVCVCLCQSLISWVWNAALNAQICQQRAPEPVC